MAAQGGAPDPHDATALTAPDGPWVPPSWDEVVREHSARVHRLAFRLTGNRDDADDLTQEVFIRVFRSLGSYVPGTFEGWLHRITTNLFLDQARRRRRLRFDALTDEIAARLPDRGVGPERAFEAGRFDVDVQAALDTLSPGFRAVVVLADVEGLTYEEVGRVLDLKTGTVRSRLSRARAQLRRHLQHRDPAVGTGTAGPRQKPASRPAARPSARPASGVLRGPGRVVPLTG